jgi:hypothetical protein
MEFRLIYEGSLPSEGGSSTGPHGRANDKHRLRKYFHPQMRELWKQHPDLLAQSRSYYFKSNPGEPDERIIQVLPVNPMITEEPRPSNLKTWVEHIADDHQLCGGRFVPLVSERGGFTCSLEILFLRRDSPGNLIQSGGDIDNRVKVLLDGLRMPKSPAELGNHSIDSADENPFFCLLEDDKLITRISVTTDRLLVPQRANEKVNDVFLVIDVVVVNPSQIFAGNRLV